MTLRLCSVLLVLGGALADVAGAHSLAYYALVAAVPIVALAALNGLGDVLDGSAAEPAHRGLAALSAMALPFLLLAAAARAPLVADAAPPAISVTALVCALGVFACQGLLLAVAAVDRTRTAPSAARADAG
jgi:hypothetical protein